MTAQASEMIIDEDFSKEGFARVRLNNKWNFINESEKILSEIWFDCVWRFYNGYAKVQLNDKWNFIDPMGVLLSENWFSEAHSFNYEGCAVVELSHNKWGVIDKSEKLVSENLCDNADIIDYTFSTMETTGTIIEILSLQYGISDNGNKWVKRDIIIQTEENYPKTICMSLWDDMFEILCWKFNKG